MSEFNQPINSTNSRNMFYAKIPSFKKIQFTGIILVVIFFLLGIISVALNIPDFMAISRFCVVVLLITIFLLLLRMFMQAYGLSRAKANDYFHLFLSFAANTLSVSFLQGFIFLLFKITRDGEHSSSRARDINSFWEFAGAGFILALIGAFFAYLIKNARDEKKNEPESVEETVE